MFWIGLLIGFMVGAVVGWLAWFWLVDLNLGAKYRDHQEKKDD